MKLKLSIEEISVSEEISGIAEQLTGDLLNLWQSGKYQIKVGKVLYTHARKTKKGMMFVSRKEYNDFGGYREVSRQISPTQVISLVKQNTTKDIQIG